ncbi:hypothetical protein BGX23_009064 [Mortierella sp. AD031]|nr:hypothetical protein BGX23_009064 [Mortierella sp. AD031]
MVLKQRYTAPIMATLATIFPVLSVVQADRVFLTKPIANTEIYSGCPVDIGFRVQYSDLAMLRSVQLQVLGTDNSVLLDNLGYISRVEWDDTRTREVSWTVPADWTPGDYVLRAFGNATYPCVEDGYHTHCTLVLEDRETVHLKPLEEESQGCPMITKTLIGVDPTTTIGSQVKTDGPSTTDGQPISTGSNNSIISSSVETTNATDIQTKGTDGSSTQLHIILNEATFQRIQDQTIRQVLNDTQDCNFLNATVTLLNGTVVPMSDLMDNATTTRFIHTLEVTNSTLIINTNNSSSSSKSTSGFHVTETAELIEAIHKNSSLIQAPSSINSSNSTSFTLGRNGTAADQAGRGFAQHDDSDQIQDKSNEALGNISAQLSGRVLVVAAMVLIAGSWAL